MTEKTVVADAQARKERFEFILTINNNIVCQRYFKINGFRNESLSSLELVDSIERCVAMIDEDLKVKTDLYNMYAAPQVFENAEEMQSWVDKGNAYKLEVPTYVALRNSDETYVWNGESMEPYDKYFNASDFTSPLDEEGEWTLKFAFCDNGREVCSKIWDASVYPRFVRSNIDLSNSRNKYDGGDAFMPVESGLIKIFNANQEDLIPQIISEICRTCCNYKDGYTTTDTYRNTVAKQDEYGRTYYEEVGKPVVYNLNNENADYKYFRSVDKYLRKKH